MMVSFIFLLIFNAQVISQGKNSFNLEYVPNEVLVKFKKDVGKNVIKAVINSLQGKIITYLDNEISSSAWNPDNATLRSFRLDPNLLHIRVPENIGTEQSIYLLKLNSYVEYAEENIILHSHENPNDPYFELHWQWGLDNWGDESPAEGTENANISAPEAWDIFTGSSDIVVAVIDSGVDLNHEDLKGNFWTNPGEITGNEIDDDDNGYIDDIHGWDFYQGDWVPLDENGHGTHIAGIIGARTNNNNGIAGINWSVSIMVLRASDENGVFELANVIDAIDYATENGAHLSNNSYGWYADEISQGDRNALKEAIERAKDAGKLFIASCGNKNTYNISYPVRYDLENIISVLATDHNDLRAPYSNYHPYMVALGAPGGYGPLYSDPDDDDIYSTLYTESQIPPVPSNEYCYKYGTSMAAPHVAGVAALIWGYPVKIWWDQVKQIILDNVDELSALNGKCLTEGRLNAYKPFTEPSPSAPTSLNGYPTAWTQININWQDNSNNEIGFEIQRKKQGENDYSTIEARKENITYYYDKSASGGITHYYRVRAYNLGGNSSFSTKTITIPAVPPAAPSGLWARSPSPPDGVQLSWYDSSNNELEFIIERKSFSYPIWEEIGGAGPNESRYFDEDVQPGETYWYRVRAYNPIGYSNYSNVIQVIIWDF